MRHVSIVSRFVEPRRESLTSDRVVAPFRRAPKQPAVVGYMYSVLSLSLSFFLSIFMIISPEFIEQKKYFFRSLHWSIDLLLYNFIKVNIKIKINTPQELY